MKSCLVKGMAAVLMLCSALTANAASRSYTLYVTSGSLTINGSGGATLNAWGYGQQAGAPSFPGPQLVANDGDTVTVTVINNHNINHNFVIQGVTSDATAIAPGASRSYTFTASAGTYLYSDTLNNKINREMGLYGSLAVKAAGGANTVWTNGPAFSFERTWVVGEMDKPRWNDVAGTGGTVSTATYKPNYFIINGKGGFDAMNDLGVTTIDGGVGQTALIRIVNGGQFSHSLHFHANHFQVVNVNGVNQSSPFVQGDVINVPPMSTAEVLFYLNQPGDYPMHVHTAQMETANGVYLNGVATMLIMK